jgi:hypothetical protein
MILLGAFILFLIAGIVLLPSDNQSGYNEYCNLECWSRKRPCCKTY